MNDRLRWAVDTQSVERFGYTEASYFLLPHPRRLDITYGRERYESDWGESLSELKKILRNANYSIDEVCYAMQQDEFFQPYLARHNLLHRHPKIDELSNLFAHLRYIVIGGKLFQTTDALNDLLEKSDLGDKCSCCFLRLPFPSIYILFGETRTLPIKFFHSESGWHTIEGAYVVELNGRVDCVRGLEITLIGSPEGKQHILDDTIETLIVEIGNEDDSLLQTLARTFDSFTYEPGRPVSAERKEEMKRSIIHLAKSIMYLNTQCAQKIENFALTEAMKKHASLGQKKKAKQERKMKRLYDKILLGPSNLLAGQIVATGKAENGKSPHWRRGHFCECHKNNPDLKSYLKFIAPMLIREDLVGKTTVLDKPYKITD